MSDKDEHEETCVLCGGFAGFETSPEGESCYLCGNWVCSECVDWEMMRKLEITVPVCVECTKEGLDKDSIADLTGPKKKGDI